jgi:hypothetical protein
VVWAEFEDRGDMVLRVQAATFTTETTGTYINVDFLIGGMSFDT